MDPVWGVILIALGLFMVCQPRLLWELSHMLTVKGGQPTELYLLLQRIGGGICIVVGIINLAAGWLLREPL